LSFQLLKSGVSTNRELSLAQKLSHKAAMFPEVPKCPKAASRTDLIPELEILIDTQAYNGVKVIMKCYSAARRD
jgi:hypothetical protein